MVLAQALASQALWVGRCLFGSLTALRGASTASRGSTNGQHELEADKTGRAGAGRVGATEPSRHASTRPLAPRNAPAPEVRVRRQHSPSKTLPAWTPPRAARPERLNRGLEPSSDANDAPP